MFIRLSRYIILGLIITLVAFLVTQNNKEKIKMETILLIGGISALIIFAISFRVEFYEDIEKPEAGEVQKPLKKQVAPKEIQPNESDFTKEGVLVDQRKRLRKMAVELIQEIDKEGIDDDEEVMRKVEEMLRSELNKTRLPRGKMADKVVENVMNPKLEGELDIQDKPKENRLSMQYEKATDEVIKEKLRKQLYSDEVVKRRKESDYVIMPVEEWSIPLERRKFKCIPKEEEELKQPCACGPGEGTGFWSGSFLKIRGAKKLPPKAKKKIELI